MARNLYAILVMATFAVVCGIAFTSCGDDDEPNSGSDPYNLIDSHWIGNTRINQGDGLLLDNYAKQYSITFNADGTCLMKGSDNSSKTYKWSYPKSEQDKAYLPNGGVIISDKLGWVWLGTFENQDYMVLRTALHGDIVKVLMNREKNTETCDPIQYTVAYDNSISNWDKCFVWIWDDNDASINYTGGTWPGAAMENLGSGIWEYKFISTTPEKCLKVVFSNGNEGGGNQTMDFQFINEGTYTLTGIK